MKWWVWVIIALVVLSGGFWIIMIIGAKAEKNKQMQAVRDAKAAKNFPAAESAVSDLTDATKPVDNGSPA